MSMRLGIEMRLEVNFPRVPPGRMGRCDRGEVAPPSLLLLALLLRLLSLRADNYCRLPALL